MAAGAITALKGLTLNWRPAFRLWHRWFGLLAGVWLLLLAVSGCVITFYEELDTALNRDWRTVSQAPAEPVSATPIGDAMARAQTEIPGFTANYVDLPDYDGESLWLIGRRMTSGGPVMAEAFLDPRDGRLLGWRDSERLALDRRHLMSVMYGLHTDLLLGEVVTTILGWVSLAWLIDHVVAAVLAVPKLKQWAQAFVIKGRAGSLRHLFDLHRAPGMWLLPVTFVLALTGVTLAWPETSRDAVRLLSPVSERLHEHMPEVPEVQDPIGIDRAIALAPSGGVDSVRPMPHLGVYAVRTHDRRDVDYQGRFWTYISMTDGSVVARRHDAGDSAGDTFFVLQYALHSGQALGLTGRILVFLGGVVTAALCVTGVLLWWRRARRQAA